MYNFIISSYTIHKSLYFYFLIEVINLTNINCSSNCIYQKDGTLYKLLEYNLVEEAGKMDAPGRPTIYKTTKNFLKMFGISSLEELPELPRYKVDENEQIVMEDIIEDLENKDEE